jgi:hypothetical protein
MSRDLLLERLRALDPPTAQECFVLLWTYLDVDHLKSAENYSRARSIHPFRIKDLIRAGGTPPTGLRRVIDELATRQGADFDFRALQWLTALDKERLPHRHSESASEVGPFKGLDGLLYRVRPRNEYLAQVLKDRFGEEPTGVSQQSGSIDLHTPFMKAVPETLKPGGQTSIEVRRFETWAFPALRARLEGREVRESFTVLLWPLSHHIDYIHGAGQGDFLRLHGIKNEVELNAEVEEALATAEMHKVTLLLFPELTFSTRCIASLKTLLAGRGHASYPLLVLAGCCHYPCGEGASDHNEAVLLGYDGTELHSHRKLSAFTEGKSDTLYAEKLEVGSKLSILESPVGNLCILICLDLFHDPHEPFVRAAHANLYVVPSLSRKTSAHQERAKRLVATHRAGTFVSNRPYERIEPALGGAPLAPPWASFFQLPTRGEPRLHEPSKLPFLVFSLAEVLGSPGQSK